MANVKQLKIGDDVYDIKAKYSADQDSNSAVVRNISYGTESPTGGNNGDLYVQYNTISTHPFLNIVYPVGAIYLSTVNTNPGTLFGGTWTQIKDRFLLAAGDTYSAGNTGGAATMAHTHSVTAKGTNTGTAISINQMPSHSHYTINSGKIQNISSGSGYTIPVGNNYGSNGNFSTSNTGGGQTHTHTFNGTAVTSGAASNADNMPPYLVVYIGKRTA